MKTKQPKTYIEYVCAIIDGDIYGIPKHDKESSKQAFKKWDEKLNTLFKKAGFIKRWFRRWMISKRKYYVFKWRTTSNPSGMELVLSSAFTEPFPSTHDMPEWAVSTRMADLMILWGVSVKDSSQYRFFEKRHFVNHKMVRGIIEFDVYKLKA